LPDTPYRTTSDMLEQFSFLDDDTAYEIVVENSNAIAEKVEPIAPLKNDLYTPRIEGAEEEIKQLTYGNAEKRYGSTLTETVEKRPEKERKSSIGHSLAGNYLIHQMQGSSI